MIVSYSVSIYMLKMQNNMNLNQNISEFRVDCINNSYLVVSVNARHEVQTKSQNTKTFINYSIE